MKKKMESRNVLVLGDTHIPWEDEDSLWAIERYMAAHRWDTFVHLGDLMDLGCVSHWNDGRADTMAMQSQFEDDLNMTILALERWLKILRAKNPDVKFKYIQGN
jgi:predicted phosphodiesterase